MFPAPVDSLLQLDVPFFVHFVEVREDSSVAVVDDLPTSTEGATRDREVQFVDWDGLDRDDDASFDATHFVIKMSVYLTDNVVRSTQVLP